MFFFLSCLLCFSSLLFVILIIHHINYFLKWANVHHTHTHTYTITGLVKTEKKFFLTNKKWFYIYADEKKIKIKRWMNDDCEKRKGKFVRTAIRATLNCWMFHHIFHFSFYFYFVLEVMLLQQFSVRQNNILNIQKGIIKKKRKMYLNWIEQSLYLYVRYKIYIYNYYRCDCRYAVDVIY